MNLIIKDINGQMVVIKDKDLMEAIKGGTLFGLSFEAVAALKREYYKAGGNKRFPNGQDIKETFTRQERTKLCKRCRGIL